MSRPNPGRGTNISLRAVLRRQKGAVGITRPNPSVRRLKFRLWQLGLLPAKHVNGICGPRVRKAVREYQRRQGWTGPDADGFLGPETLRRLCRGTKFKPTHLKYKYKAPRKITKPPRKRITTPVPGYGISTPYGRRNPRYWRATGYHTGSDYAAPSGRKIIAVRGGRIVGRGWSGAFGNTIRVQSPNDREYWYCHMTRFGVRARIWGTVSAGQVLGYVGKTGNTSGNHLHLEDRKWWGSIWTARNPRW